jgi:hypothetical protein
MTEKIVTIVMGILAIGGVFVIGCIFWGWALM